MSEAMRISEYGTVEGGVLAGRLLPCRLQRRLAAGAYAPPRPTDVSDIMRLIRFTAPLDPLISCQTRAATEERISNFSS